MSCWGGPQSPRTRPRVSHLSLSLSDVTCFSHRRVSAEPLQRAEQLPGGRWRRQLWRRHAVSSRRAEDWPADPGRAAHAQRSRHGAGRPCHRGHVQDGQAVMLTTTANNRDGERKTLTWVGRSAGQDKPDPLLHGFPAVRPRPSKGCATKMGGGGWRLVALQGTASLWLWDGSLSALCYPAVFTVYHHTLHIFQKKKKKKHIWHFLFLSYPLEPLFVLPTLVAGSC